MAAAPEVAPRAYYAEELIGPAIAREYLQRNTANRPKSRGIVAEYVEAMRCGEWLFNGEAIKFDRTGALVDGQHRLEAVIKADVTIPFLVIRGLDPEVFKTIDTGKKRSAGDVLAIRGVKNPNSVGGAMRMLHRLQAREIGHKKRVSNTVLDELPARHPRLLALCEEADHAPYTTVLLTPSALMYAFYCACHIDEPRARMFFRALAGRREASDPQCKQAERLRARLMVTTAEFVKPSPSVRLAWLIEAWNCMPYGTPQLSRQVEGMPAWDPMPKFPA